MSALAAIDDTHAVDQAQALVDRLEVVLDDEFEALKVQNLDQLINEWDW